MAMIAGIYRYPVKGLSSERLDSITVNTGYGIERDRAYAIALARTAFDPQAPEHLSKVKFATLMTYPRLAALVADFSDGAEHLKLLSEGETVLDISLRAPEDVSRFDHFITAFVGDHARGPLRLVTANNHMFSDIREDWLSIVNLASVDALSAAFGKPIDPLRFRANIYVSGLPAWHERSWRTGDEITLGSGRFSVMSAISRCAAVNVDLATARIDGDLPALLRRQFGQNAMGVYIDAVGAARIATGDGIDMRNETG